MNQPPYTPRRGYFNLYVGQKISRIRSRDRNTICSARRRHTSRGGAQECSVALLMPPVRRDMERKDVCVCAETSSFSLRGECLLYAERGCAREKHPRLRILLIPAHISPEVNKSSRALKHLNCCLHAKWKCGWCV